MNILIYKITQKQVDYAIQVLNNNEQITMSELAKIIKKKQIKPKKIRLEFEFDNLPFISEWLLQFGPKVKIHEPKSLIDLQKKVLSEMVANLD